VMDYLGKVDGVPFDGGEGRDQLLELGSGRLIPGFEDQLIGAAAGQQREVSVTFPDDYAGDLGGKDATFDVTVSEVKAKVLPELDDDFASDSTEFETLAELREDVAKRLREVEDRTIEREFEQAVLEAAVAAAQIEVPDQLIHARAHELLSETLSALSRQGLSKEAYLRIAGKDEEELAHEAEPEAAAALRREAVLAAIVEAEQIEPSDEDLRAALEPAAQGGETSVEKLIEQLRSRGRLERMREDVGTRQALELIVREAKPISVEQAQARDKLWTPGKDDAESAPGQIWTPGT
jgi:trigger factor